MEKFKKYLILSQIVPQNKVKFYVNWVTKIYFSCKKYPGAIVTQNEINEHLKNLLQHCEQWHLNQASDAMEVRRKASCALIARISQISLMNVDYNTRLTTIKIPEIKS
jgi:hypothetical protein